MKIHVQHNGEEGGPYSLDEVHASLRARALSGDDPAWHEGLDAWKPLADVLFDLHRHSTEKVAPLAVEPQNAACQKATSPAVSRISRRGILVSGGVLALIALSLAGWHFVSTREQRRTSPDSPPPGFVLDPLPAPIAAPATKPEVFDPVGLAKKTRGAVVLIEVFDASKKTIATGSGFFISADGLLITNYHVIEGAQSAVAKAANGGLFPIVGALAVDRDNDLALLATKGKNLPFLNLHDTGDLEPGTRIAVMGNPLGLEGSLSEGIVSAKRDGAADHKWLQITAAISPGSSGSPVIDASGSVLGIATMVLTSGQSLNFAIPSETANALWNKAKTGSTLMPLAALKAEEPDWMGKAYSSPEYLAAMLAQLKAEGAGASARLARLNAQRDGANGERAPINDTVSKDWNNALTCANALISKYPSFAQGYWSAGEAYLAMGFSDDAMAAFQQAIKLDPSNEFVWHHLAKLYKEKGKTTQADYAFSQAIALFQKDAESPTRVGTPPAVAQSLKLGNLIRLGDIYRDAGRADDAIRAYQAAENEGEMDVEQWDDIGDFYRGVGMLDDAMRAYQAAAKLLKHPVSGFFDLAKLYGERGQIEKAVEAMHNAMPGVGYSGAWAHVGALLADKQPELSAKCRETSKQLKAQGK